MQTYITFFVYIILKKKTHPAKYMSMPNINAVIVTYAVLLMAYRCNMYKFRPGVIMNLTSIFSNVGPMYFQYSNAVCCSHFSFCIQLVDVRGSC